uniref:Transposase (Putative), gypsy type n=1 Tax=Tanacetum cinerariifolium TaxID=118510 RepID=A0A6L2N9M4_TANCI|nr:hypothetical protein [Tanacetum cinerariifolium]
MGRDTIQLETAVSTISQEYLLEFTSEYGISEDVHPELPGLGDRIVDFPEGKVGWMSFGKRPGKDTPQCYTKPLDSLKNWNYRFFWVDERVFPTAVDWRTHALKDEMQAANTYSRYGSFQLNQCSQSFQDMEDPDAATKSSGTPFAVEKSPLDFDNEYPASLMTEGKGPKDQAQETVAPEILGVERSISKTPPPKGNMPVAGAASEVREEEVAALEPRSTRGGKSLPMMGLAGDATFITPADTKGVNDPHPLSYAEPQPHPEQSMTQSYEISTGNVATMEVQDTRSAGFQNQTSDLKTLLEVETDMNKAAETKNADLTKELGSLRSQFLDLQVSHDQLTQQVSTLQDQVTGEEKLKAAFEEFKKYKDDRVEKRCAEIDVCLDALSIDFDEELYPHMLTAIAGRRWVIGHDLRLAVIKCGESTELRVEHGKANLDLEAIEAYDPEAETKYVTALHALRDLKYPMVDQLELLKDAPIDVVMASLHLESDGVSVSVPTVAPQGLAILLVGAATQTETSDDGASPRTQSLQPLGLQPAYAAGLLQEYLAYNYSKTVMDDK